MEAVPPNTPVGFVGSDGATPSWEGPAGSPALDAYRIRRRNIKRNSSTAFETLYTLTGTNGPPRWTIDHSDG